MQKNVASQKVQLFAFDTTTGAPKTGDAANLTAYVSKDHGAVTVLGDTSATEMDATNAKGIYVFDLTQGETNADELTFSAKSSTSNISITPRFISTTPNLNTVASEVTAIKAKTDSLTFTVAGMADANVVDWKGATAPAMTGDAFARLGAPAGASVSADVAAVKSDTAAVKTKTDFLPSATAGAAGGLFIAGSNAATSITTALTANVIGNVTGNLSGSVGSVTGLTASDVGAIKAKTDNLPSDPADASDIATAFSAIDVKVDAIDDFLDTEIAAIKAKTDNLPSDPADASDIATAFTGVNTKLDTIDDFLDTEVAAIKAKTDNLPSDPADASDIATSFATIGAFIDTEVAAIKAVTDKLDDTVELTSDGWIFTTEALQNVAAGGSAPTVDEIADEVETRTIAAVTVVNGLAANVITAAATAADFTTEIQAGLATASSLATLATYVDTEVAAIKAKTDNLPSDPADASDIAASLATIGGYIDTETGSILTAVNAIKEYADNTVVRGTASGTAPSITSFTSSALSPAGVDIDQFKGRIIIFDNDTTTTALRGQATDITANTGAANPLFTFTALTTAPQSGDTFSIV